MDTTTSPRVAPSGPARTLHSYSRRSRRVRTASLALAAAASSALGLGAAAHADEAYVIDNPGWSLDAVPGDGICADSLGRCTLNAAIQDGNFRSGTHTITFGVPAIHLDQNSDGTAGGGSLQQLRAPYVVIGAPPPVRTVIDGAGSGCFSLADSGDAGTGHELGADGSILQNLVIQNCNGHGISANGHGYSFLANLIGTDQTGLLAAPNSQSGISISSSRVYSNQTNQFLQDLFAAFPVQPLDNSQISSFASQFATLMAINMLGPVTISGNVISGNGEHGIEIFSENLAGVLVMDNLIGTDQTGNLALGNGGSGIHLIGAPFANLIGPGNVISGNAQHGIDVAAGAVALPNFIMGNRIGLSLADPLVHVGNQHSGIVTDTKPETAVNGHINPSGIALIIGPANVVSDNQGANNPDPDVLGADDGGIVVTSASEGIEIRGNTIGLAEFPPGTPIASTAFGNQGDGIIVTVKDIQIGGSGPGQGNVIAANARHGVVIRGSSTTGTKVLGNAIGVSPAFPGDLTLGNGADGIHVNAASTSFIGGAGGTDANLIAANGRNGVKLRIGGFANGWGHLLQRNQIYANAMITPGVAIDTDHPEDAPNPPHTEFPMNYANLDQSEPVICSGAPGEPAACAGFGVATESGGTTSLEWTVQTHGPAGPLDPDTVYRAEFFAIDAADPNLATSMTFLGEQTVTADNDTGVLNCPGQRCTAAVGGAGGQRVVMTVTDVTPITNVVGGGWMQFVSCIVFANCEVNNTSELSNVVQPMLVPVTTTTVVTGASPVAAVFGEPIDVTVAVTATAGVAAPNGTVTVTDGVSSCMAVLANPIGATSSASCTLAPAPAVGAHTATASYAGNAAFAASSDAVGSGFMVAQAATSTSINSHTPDPSVAGAGVTVDATVAVMAPGAGTPSGSIQVGDGVDGCTITLPATSCNVFLTTVGTRTLTATYGGDPSFLGSMTSVQHEVEAASGVATTTAVASVVPATIVFGEAPVTVTVSVTAQSGSAAPDGSVTVNAGVASCMATLGASATTTATGTCNLAPPLSPAGSPYTVTASYSGNASFDPSVSSGGGNGSLMVSQASTTTTIDSHTPDPSNVNAPIAVDATVAVVAPGAGMPSGTITVGDGTDSCTITLPATGCNLTPTTPGMKTLTADYAGDPSFAPSSAPGVAHTVNAGGPIGTTTAVTTVAPATSVFGQAVSVTATVTAASGPPSPDGTVTIQAGASSCVANLASQTATISTGTCQLVPSLPVAGSPYVVTAGYSGSASFAASSSSGAGNGTATVNQAATVTTIGSHLPSPATGLGPITVSAGVAVVAPGSGTPSGTITVSDGSANCTITLPATSCALTPTSVGAKNLIATYQGSSDFSGSASVGVPHTVLALLEVTGPTVVAGVTATLTLSGGGPTCTLVAPAFVAAPQPGPPGVTLPFGVVDLSASGCVVGGTVDFQIDYSEALPAGSQLWKYGPTPSDSQPSWYVMPGSSVTGGTVLFSVTDGDFGDDDLVANGTIVDPAGPGGAAIGPAEIPTLGPGGLAVMIVSLLGLAWCFIRRPREAGLVAGR